MTEHEINAIRDHIESDDEIYLVHTKKDEDTLTIMTKEGFEKKFEPL